MNLAADELVRSFSSPSSVLDPNAEHRCSKLAEVLKCFLFDRRSRWLSSHRDEPILEVYSCDGTPLKCKESYTQEWEELHVTRSGHLAREWLVQRLFLAAGDRSSNLVFLEPRLMHDKTCWTHFEAQREIAKMARETHRSSISISHHIWDRAFKEPCERHALQRHVAFDQLLLDDSDGEETGFLSVLLAWFTCVGCLAHDVHNSFRWSIITWVDNPDTMRSCWIALESLKNSFHQLVGALPAWIAANLVFEDTRDPDALLSFWSMIGLADEWLMLFMQLAIRWEDGKLKVAASLADAPSAPQQIVVALLHVWKFRTWSTSRWCAIGESCRCLVASLYTGLSSLVRQILDDPASSKYYIKGWSNLNASVVHMACIVTASSRVSERCLNSILEDDRLARRIDHIDSVRRKQVQDVLNLPEPVLEILSKLSAIDKGQLRHDIAMATAVQVGYMDVSLTEVRQLPWSLYGGDVEAKFMALAAAPAPEDATSSKIRSLMLLGYPVAELTRGVALLGEAPWSATCVEQGHSVASSIIRKHPKYGKERLTSRTVVQQAVPLFRQDPLDGRIRRAENTLARLQRKRPDRITARHAYCKMLTSEAMKQKAQGRQMPSGVSRFVIKAHGKQWAALPAHRKRVCRDYASDLAKEVSDRVQVLVNDTRSPSDNFAS